MGLPLGRMGYAYVGVGARADHGEIIGGPNDGQQDERDAVEASILRFNPADGSELAPYARGFRNPYDIAFDSQGRLFATENQPDFDPPEEFNLVVPGGEHGYPWYDCDGCFPAPPDVDIVPPIFEFVPSASPTGVTTYEAQQFPGYFDSIFVVLWSAFPGAQKVVYFAPGGEDGTDWATGFAAPVDVTVGPEGSLYVADWATGIIFRINYTG
ncbi:MAG: PQQ-dependent sugar dehydrogenase [Chloroflexota bacterium]